MPLQVDVSQSSVLWATIGTPGMLNLFVSITVQVSFSATESTICKWFNLIRICTHAFPLLVRCASPQETSWAETCLQQAGIPGYDLAE